MAVAAKQSHPNYCGGQVAGQALPPEHDNKEAAARIRPPEPLSSRREPMPCHRMKISLPIIWAPSHQAGSVMNTIGLPSVHDANHIDYDRSLPNGGGV